MKKIMMFAAALVMTLNVNAARTHVNTQQFDKVTVNVPARVRLAQGDGYALDIAGRDGSIVRGIRWTVDNGVLKINSADLTAAESRHGRLLITIISPDEPELSAGHNYEMKDFAPGRK